MGQNDAFLHLHTGLPDDVVRHKNHGDFDRAIQAVDRHLAVKGIPAALRACLVAQREILLRLPGEYPYSKAAALALIQEKIPDFTVEEFDALDNEWKIDWIYRDGIPHYFGRFFDTLCKTDATLAKRAGIVPVGADGQDGGSGRLDRLIRQMQQEGSVSARIRCRVAVKIKDDHFTKGERVRVYLPIACACDSQSDIVIEQVFPQGAQISSETAPQRVAFWEEVMEENHEFSVEFSYRHTAHYHDLTTSSAKTFIKWGDFVSDLQEQAPHIVFTPYIKELVSLLTKDITDPLEKARSFYDFITKNIKYAFMPSYFVMENIPERCARNRLGDCGVLALLFITLCRCAGIPARWESGWKAEQGFCGAHDWARFYIEPYGWLYADPSFGCGAMREGNEARRVHYFGNLESLRMVANTQFQADFDFPKAYWRADPYDNQVGEIETEHRGLRHEEFDRTKEVLAFEEL